MATVLGVRPEVQGRGAGEIAAAADLPCFEPAAPASSAPKSTVVGPPEAGAPEAAAMALSLLGRGL